jgi:hypothetical protein
MKKTDKTIYYIYGTDIQNNRITTNEPELKEKTTLTYAVTQNVAWEMVKKEQSMLFKKESVFIF